MIRQPAGKRSGIIVLWPDTGRRMRTVRSAFGQRSRIMRQIEREELNMEPVDADFVKWEIGITALFLIFMIITDNIDFPSFFRSDDSINQNAIREKLRKSRRPFVGSGRPGGASDNREAVFARAVAAAAGYIEENEDMSPDLVYAVRKRLRTFAGGDSLLENELWEVFRNSQSTWRTMCRFYREPAALSRFFSAIAGIMEDGYRISDEQRRRFLEVAAWFGCTEEDALGYISGSSGFRKSWDAGESTSGAGVMSYGEALRILGVSSLATDRDIKRAYHRLAHRCHPDMARNRGFSDDVVKVYAQKFEKVNDAWNAVRRERGI